MASLWFIGVFLLLILFLPLWFILRSRKGDREESKGDREESLIISLKIGVAVAVADGTLHYAEEEIIKNWIIKKASEYDDGVQKEIKGVLNNAVKDGVVEAAKGNLSLSVLVDHLSEIGDEKTKYETVELCLNVMAADKVADPQEMSIIRGVAESLSLDMEEVENMREKVTLNLSTELTSDEGLELLVGIKSSWSDEQKRRHLRSEFQKWNNRIISLPEGEDRKAAQNMLDNIATLRKKYD